MGALVRQAGKVTIDAKTNEELLKKSAKKVARLVQRCGYQEDLKFANYHITSISTKADMKFPIRIDCLASSWPKNAVYEPEFHCNCVFRTRIPKVVYLVTSGGIVMIP